MTAGLVLDGVIAVLLVAMIFCCLAFYRRLGELRGSRSEFAALIESFSAATERAEAGVSRILETGERSHAELDERIETARALCDDLAFLVERGARLADRLEGQARAADEMAADWAKARAGHNAASRHRMHSRRTITVSCGKTAHPSSNLYWRQ